MTDNPINLEQAFDALRAGRWHEVEPMARLVLAADDDRRPMALHLLGLAACARRALDEGIGWLQAAVVADPQPTFMLNLANALQERNRHEEARALYERVVVAAPQDPLAHYNQGVLLKHLGETEAAAAAFSRCLALTPEHLGALNGLNACLVRLGRPEEALEVGHRGVDSQAGVERPQGRDAAENAVVDRVAQFKQEGRFEEGVAWLDGVIGHEDRPLYRLARSTLLLPLGRYREGFADFQSRLATYVPGSARYTEAFKLRDAGLPLWQGEPLAGRRLFVHPEQGQGDFIMCARFLQRLPALGAGKVLFRAIEPMATYARALPLAPGVEYLRAGATLADMDTHVSLMSLMHFLDIATDEDIGPPLAPCLPSQTIAEWQRRLGPQPMGVTWRGDPQMAGDALRSISLDVFMKGIVLPLRAQGRTIVSLQHDANPAEQEALRQQGVDITAIQTCRDWLDTAGLVAALSAVTGVCTALIHLAGSLDCPTFLLNRAPEASDWRWRWGRCDTPWYPRLHIAWQRRLGDWRGPMAEVVDRLSHSV